jgi:hypothetical protein
VERVKLPCFEQETQAGAWTLRSVRRTIHAMTRAAIHSFAPLDMQGEYHAGKKRDT